MCLFCPCSVQREVWDLRICSYIFVYLMSKQSIDLVFVTDDVENVLWEHVVRNKWKYMKMYAHLRSEWYFCFVSSDKCLNKRKVFQKRKNKNVIYIFSRWVQDPNSEVNLWRDFWIITKYLTLFHLLFVQAKEFSTEDGRNYTDYIFGIL